MFLKRVLKKLNLYLTPKVVLAGVKFASGLAKVWISSRATYQIWWWTIGYDLAFSEAIVLSFWLGLGSIYQKIYISPGVVFLRGNTRKMVFFRNIS